MKHWIFIIAVAFVASQCSPAKKAVKAKDEPDFSFVFMTDIHLQPELGATVAFKRVIDTVNKMDADFVLTGGDLVFDVLRGNRSRADSLYSLYKETIKGFNKPVYNVIGNHEVFGIYAESPIPSTDPDWKWGMFKRYFGDTYYSFDHKGWHFIALNSIDERNKRFIGIIGEEQKEWLRKDLAKVKPGTPIAMVMHIPLVSVQHQLMPPKKPITEVPNELWVSNRNELLDMFKQHNLRLVLQGHLHYLEDIHVGNTRFITGPAVAGRPSWKGTQNGEEGFLKIKVKDNNISWEFIDYGWETLYKEPTSKP